MCRFPSPNGTDGRKERGHTATPSTYYLIMAGKCIKFLIAMMFSALTIAAIVFSCLTVAACDYVTYLDDQGQTKMAGLFKFEVPGEGMEGECVTYTESEVDSLTNLEKTAMVRANV